MPPSKPYLPELIKALRDPREAVDYLHSALEDGDPEGFLLALRDVAEAQGGVAQLAEAAKLNRESLYRMLSDRGNPEFRSLDALLHALGFRLSIAVEDRRGLAPFPNGACPPSPRVKKSGLYPL